MGHSIAIVTDSTCDLPSEIIETRNIHVVPQYVVWGTESLKDGVDIKGKEFYQRLATTDVLPQTSQPSAGDFAEAYKTVTKDDNVEAIICLTVSSVLSGTYNSAVQAAEMIDTPVHVVDAKTASLPLGFLVLTAADARDEGKSFDEVVKITEANVDKIQIYFTLASLEFLHRGGRIGGAKRLFGEAFKIRPILYVEDGGVGVKESVRTRKRGLARILDIIEEVQQNQEFRRLGVIHGDAESDAQILIEEIKARFNIEQVFFNNCCSSVGVHMGPSVIGVAYQLK